jgi:hypothetical protein
MLLLSIELPKPIVDAIDRKAEQFYFLEEYDFRLLTEEKEARRKETEARGIKKFQDIIASGITESYLRWRGIDATLQLSKSPNSKVIIVGGGKDGLPIILGNVDQPGVVAPPAAPERLPGTPDGTTGLEGPLAPPAAVSTPPAATTPTPPPAATTPTPPPSATPPPSGRPSGPGGSPSR